jgi:hypothetical protein
MSVLPSRFVLMKLKKRWKPDFIPGRMLRLFPPAFMTRNGNRAVLVRWLAHKPPRGASFIDTGCMEPALPSVILIESV